MAKKDEKTVNVTDEMRKIREDLVKNVPYFRKFIVALMVKGRYMRSSGPTVSEYERGRKDAICSIVEDFVVGTDNGQALVKEYLEFIKTDKKEY